MSQLLYFASNYPMDEWKNPYIYGMSINEALEKGIDIDLDFFPTDFNQEQAGVILYCEDEEKMDYPNIYPLHKEDYIDEIGTLKEFCMKLEVGELTEEPLELIYQYIQSQIEKVVELEVWKVSLGEDVLLNIAKRSRCKWKDVTMEKLKNFYESEKENNCLVIER